MKLKVWFLVLIGVVLFPILNCVAAEKSTEQMSPEKQAIFQLFENMETAWNKQDAAAYIMFFHDDLKLKLGSRQKVKYYSKKAYKKTLPKRMAKFGPYKMVDPEIINLKGDKAKAKVIVKKKKRDYPNVFNLVRVNGEWQIISNEW